jgi:charged multivesicular body protein 4
MLVLIVTAVLRQAHLEKQQDRHVEEAKAKLAKKDKKGAMFTLKKKKMIQGQIDSIMGVMITMEQQKMALENAAT